MDFCCGNKNPDKNINENDAKIMIATISKSEKLIAEVDQKQYKSRRCCYNTCEASPINSHTISENNLYKLNNDLTKVLTFEPAMSPIVGAPIRQPMKKVSKDKFSTFTGFCKKHDCELFKPIDLFDGILSEEKAALIHYRNICYGINHIRTQMLRLEYISQKNYTRDESTSINDAEIVEMINTGFRQPLRRLKYCLSEHISRKKQLEKMIKMRDFRKIKFLVLTGNIENPVFSGRSNYLLHQNHQLFSSRGYSYMPWITYMTLLTNNTNHLVFCWLKKDNAYTSALKKLLKNKDSKIVEVLVYACSDAFAVDESFHKKYSDTINVVIKKFRVL